MSVPTAEYFAYDRAFQLRQLIIATGVSSAVDVGTVHYDRLSRVMTDSDTSLRSSGVTKYQYRDMMELLQSMERMTLAQPYRKYRPPQLTQYRGHATQWSVRKKNTSRLKY